MVKSVEAATINVTVLLIKIKVWTLTLRVITHSFLIDKFLILIIQI